MELEFIKQVLTQSIFAGVFLYQFWINQKQTNYREMRSEEREKKYQDIILTLTDKLGDLEALKADVQEIKYALRK